MIRNTKQMTRELKASLKKPKKKKWKKNWKTILKTISLPLLTFSIHLINNRLGLSCLNFFFTLSQLREKKTIYLSVNLVWACLSHICDHQTPIHHKVTGKNLWTFISKSTEQECGACSTVFFMVIDKVCWFFLLMSTCEWPCFVHQCR